ncbi:MAG TPA: hypothetical protein VKV37_11735 [Ktedonobacteraceae bacterium]|nr:hypothetical protein [Ktedonobacteraceae bacterium]
MSLATKQTQQDVPRIWKAPTSKARWLWLAGCIVFYAAILVWYLQAIRTQQFPGPSSDPLRLFGIMALVLVLATAGYTLRRRFMRGLPGKVQDWLWMHTWVGITTILLALLHENFTYITPASCQPGCLTDSYWAASALFALILLVLSGIVGRLLDRWQTHVIARDASANGVGIVRALEERILELEYTVERLCAGKSEPFKQYCLQALDQQAPAQPPALPPTEHADFQRASETLALHAGLARSLHRQRRARLILRTWRTIHMVLATLALIVILYHGIMELLTNVFHILQPV